MIRYWVILNALNIADGANTLVMLGLGASEVNPVMGHLARLGMLWFLGVKISSVAAFGAVLAARRMRKTLGLISLCYGVIVSVQLFLLLPLRAV